MKAMVTAVLMMSLFSVANASIQKTGNEPVKKEIVKNTCPFQKHQANIKADLKPNFDHYLAQAPTDTKSSAPTKKAKTADSVKRS